MNRIVRRVVVTAGLATVGTALVLPAAAASADVVTPAGACTASGTWTQGGFTRNSADYSPSSVIAIPQKDTVDWVGHEQGKPIGYVGPSRPIDGKVQLAVPFGIKVTVYHWGGHQSTKYSNQGQKSYDLPSVLIGMKLQLSGYEKDSGTTVCTGSVYVQVGGSKLQNPLGWGAIAGTVLTGLGLLRAGFLKTRPV